MPRYVRAKRLATGQSAYFFEIPTWARAARCAVASEALGTDLAAACKRANEVLLPAFDSWRTAGASDIVPAGPERGTFDWLAAIFRESRHFTEKDKATRRLYRQGLDLVGNYVLKDGRRFGALRLDQITTDVADKLYTKLRTVEDQVLDANGECVMKPDGTPLTTTRDRTQMANAAMRSARRAWNVVRRGNPKIVPASNPFSKMGLESKAKKRTPTATLAELLAFVAKADELGRASLGTAAMIAWEWVPREEDIFGTFAADHYRPKDRPDAVYILHSKTGEEAWIPLFDHAGAAPLFPELMARLDALKRTRIAGLLVVRDWKDEDAGVPVPWITETGDLSYMRHEVKRVIRAAGLRDELSFTSFRHGGLTEGGEADITDRELQALSRHQSPAVLPRYAKRTMKQIANVARKRRAARTKREDLSE